MRIVRRILNQKEGNGKFPQRLRFGTGLCLHPEYFIMRRRKLRIARVMRLRKFDN